MPCLQRGVQQRLGADDVRHDEVGGAEDRAVDVALGCEVHDHVSLPRSVGQRDIGPGCRPRRTEAGVVISHRRQVGDVPCIRELVEHGDTVGPSTSPTRRRALLTDVVAPDEARTSGDEDPHASISLSSDKAEARPSWTWSLTAATSTEDPKGRSWLREHLLFGPSQSHEQPCPWPVTPAAAGWPTEPAPRRSRRTTRSARRTGTPRRMRTSTRSDGQVGLLELPRAAGPSCNGGSGRLARRGRTTPTGRPGPTSAAAPRAPPPGPARPVRPTPGRSARTRRTPPRRRRPRPGTAARARRRRCRVRASDPRGSTSIVNRSCAPCIHPTLGPSALPTSSTRAGLPRKPPRAVPSRPARARYHQ